MNDDSSHPNSQHYLLCSKMNSFIFIFLIFSILLVSVNLNFGLNFDSNFGFGSNGNFTLMLDLSLANELTIILSRNSGDLYAI